MSDLRAYEGNEPFAFACYAYKDSARVLPILEQLYQRGVRVWYDQGIVPGAEWGDLLTHQIDRSDTVLVFLSAAAAESRFCQNEIHYAEKKKKTIIVIYLEDMNLQPSLEMILASRQAVYARRYASDADLAEHLSTAIESREYQPIGEAETPASMPPQKTNDPTQPYDGDEPYIFISYAHRDDKAVLPIVEELSRNGYRVWYDQGIDPGTEWDENIAQHVEDCGCFIAFLSKNYLDSDNCKDELNYARDLNKERLIVYLEQVRLPGGLAMRINRLQAIYKYTYRSQTDFYNKLFSTPSLGKCGKGTAVPSAEPSPPPEKPRVEKPSADTPSEPKQPLKKCAGWLQWVLAGLALFVGLFSSDGVHIEDYDTVFMSVIVASVLAVFALRRFQNLVAGVMASGAIVASAYAFIAMIERHVYTFPKFDLWSVVAVMVLIEVPVVTLAVEGWLARYNKMNTFTIWPLVLSAASLGSFILALLVSRGEPESAFPSTSFIIITILGFVLMIIGRRWVSARVGAMTVACVAGVFMMTAMIVVVWQLPFLEEVSPFVYLAPFLLALLLKRPSGR